MSATPVPDPVTDPDIQTGIITFGKDYDEETLHVTGPATKFKTTSKSIAWSASFSETLDATTVTIIIASQSKSGVEKTLIKTDADVANPDTDLMANKIDLAEIVDRKAGTYVMRYLRENDLLAEGTFTLTK